MAKDKKSAGFMEAPQVSLALQQALIDHHEDSWLTVQDVLCMFSRKPIKERGQAVPFKVSKLSGLPAVLAAPKAEEGVFTEPVPKFLVLVHYNSWHLMSPEVQAVMADKALCYCLKEALDKGGYRLSVVRPDVEEFSDIVARHGANWMPPGLVDQAVSGQPALQIASTDEVMGERPANPRRRTPAPIADQDYEEGRLSGQAGAG